MIIIIIVVDYYTPLQTANKGLHVVSMGAKKELKLGRGHESDVRIADVSISRYHATIRFSDGTLLRIIYFCSSSIFLFLFILFCKVSLFWRTTTQSLALWSHFGRFSQSKKRVRAFLEASYEFPF